MINSFIPVGNTKLDIWDENNDTHMGVSINGVPKMDGLEGKILIYKWMMTGVPSGKCLRNYGKSPFFIGKSTISMAIFNS